MPQPIARRLYIADVYKIPVSVALGIVAGILVISVTASIELQSKKTIDRIIKVRISW